MTLGTDARSLLVEIGRLQRELENARQALLHSRQRADAAERRAASLFEAQRGIWRIALGVSHSDRRLRQTDPSV